MKVYRLGGRFMVKWETWENPTSRCLRIRKQKYITVGLTVLCRSQPDPIYIYTFFSYTHRQFIYPFFFYHPLLVFFAINYRILPRIKKIIQQLTTRFCPGTKKMTEILFKNKTNVQNATVCGTVSQESLRGKLHHTKRTCILATHNVSH